MHKRINSLLNLGTSDLRSDGINQSIRFANIIALLHMLFIVLVFFILLYQYGFKAGAKLVLISSIIPILTISLNAWYKPNVSKFWLSYIIPLFIVFISVLTKLNNPAGYTQFYEFFDTRILVLVSAIIPLMVFPRYPLLKLLVGLLPSAFFLLFFDQVHQLFGVGYTHHFSDPKGGYYIAGIFFDVSYLFFVIGILTLKASNEKLLDRNQKLILDLNKKNNLQEELLSKKQELLLENKEMNDELLDKQKELLFNKKELELATAFIKSQKKELEFKNKELVGIVAERTKELKKANAELIVQNNGLLQFSNTVSHNLRAPVASMLGLVRLFEVEKDEKRRRKTLEHIKSSTVALDTIISDLNKVVDIRNQLFHLKEDICLSKEVEIVYQLLKVGLSKIGATIDTNLKEDKIYFIRSYIHSILFNLISNAMKYSHPDRKNIIQVNSWKQKKTICVEVKDRGLGIDLEKFSAHLFKMYKRFHDHIDGKGMGLYLVKQQVEAMNGKISVESKLDVGTTFLMQFLIPEEVYFQEYYNSANATIAYDADLRASVLIWKQKPNSQEYQEVLTTNKEMFANYSAVHWLVDVRNLGQISEKDRKWFSSVALLEIIRRGCTTISIIRDQSDGKDFSYWQNMLEVTEKLKVEVNLFFDYDIAIEHLKEVEVNLDN